MCEMPTIFLDRDGTINERVEKGYVTSWDAFRFLPGAKEALRRLAQEGYRVLVVSNQAGVGKGLMSQTELDRITTRFCRQVDRSGGRIDEVFYCTHTPAEECDCRKPKPGLLLRAAEKYGVLLDRAYFIGDSDSDVLAGQRAGCRTILIRARPTDGREAQADFVVNSLSAAVDVVLKDAV